MTAHAKLKHATIWHCDQCGRNGRWDHNWWSGGSLALHDTQPWDVPTLCSDECREKFEAREKAGKVEVPETRTRDYETKVIGKRKGY